MKEPVPDSLGYSTQVALQRLRADISQLLRDYELSDSSRFRFLSDIISISSEKVLLSGVAYSVTFLYILCLVLTYVIGDSVQADLCLLLEALFLLAILVVNFLVAVNEDVLRRKEIPNRIKHVIAALDDAASKSVWRQQNYPHLCAPFSPCVTLQWTYRDGMIVNLPWALLVRGDVVVLRPGQELPGRCVPLNTPSPDILDCAADAPSAHPLHLQKEKFTRPRMRVPHKNRAYRMLETPCLSNLRLALDQAQDRPITVYNKQRYLCTVKLMEGVVLPLVISLVVVASVVRHIYVLPGVALWTEIYFLQTIAASLPLLQIVFPLAWVTLNCYGMARFKLLSESKQKLVQQKSCSLSEDVSDPLLEVLVESDLKTGSLRALAATFFSILVGREDMVTRTSNIVHVLGSLSALCCVDKKGILSWPNPTAEKVFFLRNANSVSRSSSKTSLVDSMDHHSQSNTEQSGSRHRVPQPEPNTVAEVLDLTHDQNAPFSVEFDDQAWRAHLLRLKPLGLAALLNTCAPTPRHIYSHFCAHLTCEAQLSEDLVPVTNRRCLCELAKQIGFDEESTENYAIKECLAVFRHLQADTIRRETRFARSLHLSTRVKVPLPHMLATVVADPTKALQLLSQGTADIVLDSCSDYWDGSELTPLSPSDRKKVLDFYQRSSLTAYCTAFAYKPLEQSVEHGVASMYLELPADCRHLYPSALEHWSDHSSALAYQFHSTDSLLYNDTIEKEDASDAKSFFNLQSNQVFLGMVTMQYQAQSDMVELVERLERACVRFVHFSKENELRSRVFSEKMGLESGWNCHISLMSDHLTSKPASPLSSQNLPPCSEKRPQTDAQDFNSKLVVSGDGGRDAEGYGVSAVNFNYSNMESSKPLSMSAPGAINLDHTTVKFDSETKRARHSIPAQHDDKMECEWAMEGGAEEGCTGAARGDSPGDACRSLSCLTDSTDHSAPLNFDMSNRAKLPRGIDNIRPHIEQVDNVPLLVSLFTDCTAASACRMIRIMQDYSEVVCVIGSAANRDNMHIFMRADASIAVEPLYPVVCQEMPPYQVPTDCVGPIDLARALNAVPCSISNTRDSDISLFSLITMSRHFMTSLWNATQFWMCSVCSLSLLQVGSLLGFLPLCLSVGGAVWSGVLVTPALSAALTFAPLDPLVMQRAATHTRHYANIDKQVMIFVFWCYGCKFIPSILSILALYGATLRSFCEQVARATGSTACTLVYPVNAGNVSDAARDLTRRSWHGWGDDFYEGYYLAQHIALILVTVHLIIISMSFVDRNASIWQKCFWTNKVWSVTVFVVLIVQCIFSGAMLSRRYGLCENWDVCELRYRVPWTLMFGYILSPTLVFCLNEFIKWQEIKANHRYQRRARLDFGTKLGMNSPF